MAPFPDRVLAVDIGTSSVRAMVFERTGRVVARTQVAYSTIRPAPYFEEQDPDLVRREAYRAMAECLAQPGAEAGRVGAISFSSQLYGIIALDGADRPLTRNILWSDGRAEPQADAMKAAHGAQWLYPVTGCPMNSIFPIAKLVWLREKQPGIFAAAARFISIKEYVAAPLIGAWAIDYSMASATGLFDIHRHGWHPASLEAAGIREDQLSRAVSGLRGFPLVENSPLAQCGLPASTRVFLGGGDGPLANLGSGASRPGAVNIDLGTSGAARCMVTRPVVDDAASLWCFCLTDELWTYGGILTNVGNAYQWLATNVLGATGLPCEALFEMLNREAVAVTPGAEGLHFLPYLRRARSPSWDGRLKGTLYGLTADHTIGHIAGALLEAIAYDLRTVMELIRRGSETSPPVVLTGGLARSPLIPQLLADVLDEEIFVPDEGEGSIAGAAILGLKGMGVIGGFDFISERRTGRTFVPRRQYHDPYMTSYRQHLRLVEALRGVAPEGEQEP